MANLAGEVIDRDSAKEQLLALLKEEKAIENDPEYWVEQKLAQVYYYPRKNQEKARPPAKKKLP